MSDKIPKTEMEFSDSTGSKLVFELETTEKGSDNERMLRKLGDGNFGCVFAAKGGYGQLALKVIYEHQATSKGATEGTASEDPSGEIDYKMLRTVNELRVKEIIYDRLQNSDDEEIRRLISIYNRHLVLPLAYTMNLDEDEVFQKYASVYGKYDMVFSRYAYVMDRFDCSLKDLMEHGGRMSSGASDRKRTAYDRLKSVSLVERERSALPAISQVANGLRVLHAVGLRHQDIKPANIYYRDNVGIAEFVLGDLGFLYAQNPIVAGSAMASTDALVIGTKHYRSIEQIDHSDVSEVSIESGPDEGTVTVVSSDPKFLRTNIRAGDLVVFPRSNSRTLFDIADFQVLDVQGDEASPEVRMTIASRRGARDEGRDDGGLLSLRDGLTQASFVKNPTERTDLFGLGAVLFDILSAGESAERFYELLRKFDVRGTRIRQSILNFYPTWKSGQAVAPDISAIFQRVCGHGRSYLNPGMMAFLLNCMMSEPDDSFYMKYFKQQKQNDEYRGQTGWPAVSGSIDALIRELGAQDYRYVVKNALTAEKPPQVIDSPLPSREAISVLLPTLQESGIVDRWLLAASFLNAMMELTRRITNKIRSPKNETAFISLKPEHLVLSRDDQIIKESDIVGHYTASQYLGQLMVLDPLFSSLTTDPSSFLPIWWPSRLRRVNVRLWPDDQTAASMEAGGVDDVIRVSTKTTDCTAPGQDTQPGDFLVVSNEESAHSLYDVEDVEKHWLGMRKNHDVEAERENSSVEFRTDEDRGGYLVKAFDACSYYGGMLAVYLFYALFAGGGRNGVEHFGRAVISNAHYFPINHLTKPSEEFRKQHRGWSFGRNKPAKENELVKYTVRLYVWLMLGGFHRDVNQMDSIRSEISQWKDQVADSLGRPRDEVDSLIFQYPRDDEPAGDRDPGEELRQSFQIDEETWERVAQSYLSRR